MAKANPFSAKKNWRLALPALVTLCSGIVSAQVFTPPRAPMPPMNLNYTWPKSLPMRSIQAFLKDGQTLKDTSVIHPQGMFNASEHITLMGRKITPAETDSIIADSFVGVPDEGVWVWRTIIGKMTVYTTDMDIGSKDYRFFHKGSGPMTLTPFSTDAVRQAMADDPIASRLVRSYQTGKIVYIGMMVAGAACAAYGFMRVKDPEGPQIDRRIPVFGGAGIFLGAAIPYFMTRKNLTKAIDRYNQ